MSKINEFKAIYFNPDDTDFEKMNNIKRITTNIDNKCLSDMLFNRDEKLLEIINIQQQRIDEAIEYCEDITSREIDISDTDYELGEDFTARDILKILRGKNERFI